MTSSVWSLGSFSVFEVGMKKDWIWTEEARIRKRQTTVNRRRSEKRQRYSETDNDVSSSGFVNSPANSEPRQISGDSIEGNLTS